MKNTQISRFSFVEKFKILVIDFTCAFFLFQIIRFIVSYFFFIPSTGLLHLWLLCHIVLCIFWKQTLGGYFFGIKLVDQSDGVAFKTRIALKELLTSLPGILWIIFCYIRYISVNLCAVFQNELLPFTMWSTVTIFIVLIIITLLRVNIFKIRMIKYAFTNKECFLRHVRRHIIITYSLLLLFAILSRYFHTYLTNDIERVKASYAELPLKVDLNNNIFDLWDWSCYTVPRPSIHSVQKYSRYLNTNRKGINDYIISLFDKYDHIILCERLHTEMTQYDMIYHLVTDSRFVEKVGNVFTEIGNIESRNAYKEFTDTDFPNDTVLEQALSLFMMDNQTYHLLWNSTNWYNFLKNISQFNYKKKKKVEILFSDRANWKYDNKSYNRDSLMANNIITTVKENNIKKSLIIMNYRHAYLVGDRNCGHIISTEFSGKVANILINTVGWNMCPLQSGKWDVAFEQMPEDAYAFDLKNSPFGKDRFDHYFFPSSLSKLHYEDMFTGIIYYKPLSLHYISFGFPYMMQTENVKILRERAAKLGEDFREDLYHLSNGRIKGLKIQYFASNLLNNTFFIWNLLWGLGMLIYLGTVYIKTNEL